MSWSPVLISARTQKLEDTIRGHLKSITMHMSTFLRLPLMIVEIQLHRSFLPNVITMVLKLGASLWLAMPIHWYALLFDLIFHFIMFSVSDNIYLNILSSSDLKLWISNWNNLQKYPGYSFFTKLHWCRCGWGVYERPRLYLVAYITH